MDLVTRISVFINDDDRSENKIKVPSYNIPRFNSRIQYNFSYSSKDKREVSRIGSYRLGSASLSCLKIEK